MLKLVLTTDQTGPALEADLVEISNLLHVDVEAVGLDGYVSARVSYLNPALVGHDEVTVADGAKLTFGDEPHPVFEKADPPSVETVPEPVVPAPAETPAE